MEGTLTIYGADSRLDGILLIQRGYPQPPAKATGTLQASGLVNGDRIVVTGSNDAWQGEAAINMTSARRKPEV